jgi:hypothetical protein
MSAWRECSDSPSWANPSSPAVTALTVHRIPCPVLRENALGSGLHPWRTQTDVSEAGFAGNGDLEQDLQTLLELVGEAAVGADKAEPWRHSLAYEDRGFRCRSSLAMWSSGSGRTLGTACAASPRPARPSGSGAPDPEPDARFSLAEGYIPAEAPPCSTPPTYNGAANSSTTRPDSGMMARNVPLASSR